MAIEIPKEKWTAQVREVTIGATSEQGGTRAKTLTVGGESALPFLHYEGSFPNRTALAVEIRDRKPDDWSPLLLDALGETAEDPAKWAQAAEEMGADRQRACGGAQSPGGNKLAAGHHWPWTT